MNRVMMLEELDRKNAVLRAMSDDYERRILAATISNAKSIEQISNETDIPVSTCYRRVHELNDLRLLRIEKIVITDSGKKYETYRSNLKGARVTLVSGELTVDVEVNRSPGDDKLDSMWKAMRQSDGSKISQDRSLVREV